MDFVHNYLSLLFGEFSAPLYEGYTLTKSYIASNSMSFTRKLKLQYDRMCDI